MSQKSLIYGSLLFLFAFIGLVLGLRSNAQEPPMPRSGMPDPPTVSTQDLGIAVEELSPEERERFIRDVLNNLWRYVPDLETHKSKPLAVTANNGQIAYAGTDGHLYLMNPDGTAQRKIIDELSSRAWWPTWSHDSQYLALSVDGENDDRCLYKFHLDTRTYTELVCGFVSLCSPEWSPQDNRIAFFGKQEAETSDRAWVIDADGSDLTEIAPGLTQNWRPVWVDGDTVAFPGESSPQVWKLYVANPDQPGDPQPITPEFTCGGCSCSGPLVTFPDTLLDGQQIAFLGAWFESDKLGGCNAYLAVYLVDKAGANPPSKIVDVAGPETPIFMGMLKWAPDNRRIGVSTSSGSSVRRLSIVDTETGTRTVLPDREGMDWRALDWSPDGTRMAVGYAPSGTDPEIVSVDPTNQTFNVLAYGELPTWGTLPPVPPPEVTDLAVTHIEITQGLQDWDQNVPLIEGKSTFARVYVTATVDTLGVGAVLSGTLDGQPLSDSPLSPMNSGHRIVVRASGGDRAYIHDSLYFHLPDSWLVEGVELVARVDPDGEIPETDENNNTFIWPWTVQFETTNPVHITFVPVIVPREPDKIPDYSDAHMAATWLNSTYPVAYLSLHDFPVQMILPPACLGGLTWVPCRWWLFWELKAIQVLSSADQPELRVYGIVHEDVNTGDIAGQTAQPWQRWKCSWGKVGKSVPPPGSEYEGAVTDRNPRHYYGRIMAHEIGHAYGLPHLINPTNDQDPECVLAEDSVPGPHPDGHIGESGDPASFFGLDTFVSPPQIYRPIAYDMMTYCWDQYWISYGPSDIDGSFDRLHEKLRATSQSSQPEVMFQEDQLWLIASGILTPTTNVVELLPFYVLPDLAPSYAPQPGEYSVELYDAGDTLLVSHPFTPSNVISSPAVGSQESQAEPDPSAPFLEVLPYDPATAYIRIKHGSTVLSVVPVSAHSPQITVTHPNGGEVLTGTVSLTWNAEDEDGDSQSYAVRYSADGGTTWIALAASLADETYELDTSQLPGTEQGVIQVIATDGVNTVTDSSDEMLSVPSKGPAAYIALPTDGSILPGNTAVTLAGSAYDPEDGPLAGSQLSWTSSRDGTLGDGELFLAQGLSHGEHTITLTARDGQGNEASDRISIQIGFDVYLPMLMRNA